MTDDTVTINDIAQLYGCSVRTVRDEYAHDPSFPSPVVAYSQRKRQWLRSDVRRC